MGDFKAATTLLLLLAATTVMAGGGHISGCKEISEYITVNHDDDDDSMEIQVMMDQNGRRVTQVSLKGFENFEECRAMKKHNYYLLRMNDSGKGCGYNRCTNLVTGKKTYSAKLIIKFSTGNDEEKSIVCSSGGKQKRDVLPPEFIEPDFIEITSEVSGTAPIPILNVGVRQNGQLVGGQISVRPGTPLTMEVFLDDVSAKIYGILMHNMEVTDMANKRETIIFNGCSVDPILFDNFITTTGDTVAAKFRAFKFPETNYVMFRGTVDVCLDKCQGIACSNGQVGYGRRRRGIDDQTPDPNKIFEVTMMTILKIEEPLNDTMSLEKRLAEEVQNQMAEELKTMELALQEMKEERMMMEQALREETNPWRRPAVVSVIGEDRTSIQSSERREPGYINYSSAETLSQSLLLLGVTAAALLALRV
ncbi:hypothetical protein O3P69_001140 [Scylla paramamosain]|uniref:ZP domain-containing protein n=1 Tax=Scylla paramamosain TaxID=85552 RepID=A0AAW0UP63_SCYPA